MSQEPKQVLPASTQVCLVEEDWTHRPVRQGLSYRVVQDPQETIHTKGPCFAGVPTTLPVSQIWRCRDCLAKTGMSDPKDGCQALCTHSLVQEFELLEPFLFGPHCNLYLDSCLEWLEDRNRLFWKQSVCFVSNNLH